MEMPYSLEPVVLLNEVFPGHTNALNTLFGGHLMSIMDTSAGMVASKFAHREFVTISIDSLTFIAPARKGDLLEVSGKVVFTSSHTACSKVTALAVNKSTWEKKKICEGYFFFVAIDSMMRPIPIPQFVVEHEEEKRDWERAKEIREHMLAMKNK